MQRDAVRLFYSIDHPCGYFPDRLARNLLIDPIAEPQQIIYEQALTRGFRRAGGHVYRPHCQTCKACVASRIPVEQFSPDRSQRRNLRNNQDLEMKLRPAAFGEAQFALYQRYLSQRHAGGGMENPSPDDFMRFLTSAWSKTWFLEFRLAGELICVAVTDVAAGGLSSVYTFYDADLSHRGLGTFAILSQVNLARKLKLPHVYLGYWIDAHPKMHYKAKFQPLEVQVAGVWQKQTVKDCVLDEAHKPHELANQKTEQGGQKL
jgi:leucyl-tRNA---protein transferase